MISGVLCIFQDEDVQKEARRDVPTLESCTAVALDIPTGQGFSRLAGSPQHGLYLGHPHRANHDPSLHSTTHTPSLRCHDFFRMSAMLDH